MKQLLRHAATRIAGMLGIGRITSQKDGGVVQTVQYQTPLEVATSPRMAEFGFSSALPVGSDVVLAFMGGIVLVRLSSHRTTRGSGGPG